MAVDVHLERYGLWSTGAGHRAVDQSGQLEHWTLSDTGNQFRSMRTVEMFTRFGASRQGEQLHSGTTEDGSVVDWLSRDSALQ